MISNRTERWRQYATVITGVIDAGFRGTQDAQDASSGLLVTGISQPGEKPGFAGEIHGT